MAFGCGCLDVASDARDGLRCERSDGLREFAFTFTERVASREPWLCRRVTRELGAAARFEVDDVWVRPPGRVPFITAPGRASRDDVSFSFVSLLKS